VTYDSISRLEQLRTQPGRANSQNCDRGMMIGTYLPSVVEYLPYDSECRRVADVVAAAIVRAGGNLHVEHIGSTAVPFCWGKGIIDLVVAYTDDALDKARNTLDWLGFQKQLGVDPFPESRPMRVGSIKYFGRTYRIHAHVIERESDEARALVRFRDLLRDNIFLRRAYEAEKRAILARGINEGSEYSKAKGEFIRRALKAAGAKPESST
jgi:GrpB-like predicted nucleotidyltransferase (UPF0157 family)